MYREMDTTRLQAYILFVSQHIDDVSKDELNELIEVWHLNIVSLFMFRSSCRSKEAVKLSLNLFNIRPDTLMTVRVLLKLTPLINSLN